VQQTGGWPGAWQSWFGLQQVPPYVLKAVWPSGQQMRVGVPSTSTVLAPQGQHALVTVELVVTHVEQGSKQQPRTLSGSCCTSKQIWACTAQKSNVVRDMTAVKQATIAAGKALLAMQESCICVSTENLSSDWPPTS
jgi:hypothetical protein